MTMEDLIHQGVLPDEAARFLETAVRGRLTVLVSGPPRSGKTALLGALAEALRGSLRHVVSVEHAPQLKLEDQLLHATSLRVPGPSASGSGAQLTMGDLLVHARGMLPDLLVVDELADAAACDVLFTLCTSPTRALAAITATTPDEALQRLIAYAAQATPAVPMATLAQLAAARMDLVVQLAAGEDGRGRVTRISEVTEPITSSPVVAPPLRTQELWARDPATERLIWQGITAACWSRLDDPDEDEVGPEHPPAGVPREHIATLWRQSIERTRAGGEAVVAGMSRIRVEGAEGYTPCLYVQSSDRREVWRLVGVLAAVRAQRDGRIGFRSGWHAILHEPAPSGLACLQLEVLCDNEHLTWSQLAFVLPRFLVGLQDLYYARRLILTDRKVSSGAELLTADTVTVDLGWRSTDLRDLLTEYRTLGLLP